MVLFDALFFFWVMQACTVAWCLSLRRLHWLGGRELVKSQAGSVLCGLCLINGEPSVCLRRSAAASCSLFDPTCVCLRTVCLPVKIPDKSARLSHSHGTAGGFVSSRFLLTPHPPLCATGFLGTDARWWWLVRTLVVRSRCVWRGWGRNSCKVYTLFFPHKKGWKKGHIQLGSKWGPMQVWMEALWDSWKNNNEKKTIETTLVWI